MNETADDILARALGLHQADRLGEAGALYRDILKAQPDHADALHYLGVIALQEGRGDEAVRLIGQSLDVAPANADALNNLGQAFERLGRMEDAKDAYSRAIEAAPGAAQAHVRLGEILAGQGEFVAAADCLDAALKLEPGDPYLMVNRGNLHRARGDLQAALAAFEQAAKAAPGFAEAQYNLGRALQDLDRPNDAGDAYAKALKADPGYVPALVNLGLVHLDLGRHEEAMACLKDAVEKAPDYPPGHYNLGLVLQDMDRFDDAIASYRRAIALDDGFVEAHYNLGIALLKLGHLADGWDEYEWRFQSSEKKKIGARHFPQAQWQGEDLAGRSLLVWAEQGVGDEVLFAGMVPDLLAKGADVTLECDSRLAPLFERSFPGIRCLDKTVPPMEETLSPDFDFQVPSGSLARHLRRDFESFIGTGPYLLADADKTRAFREKYDGGDSLKIGLAWLSKNKREGLSRREGMNKSMALKDLSALAEIDGITLVDLQYGNTASERNAFAGQTGVTVLHDDDVDQMTDLDAFAAQVAAMDLVLSISNTTVHMAGALGVPCWVMLNAMPLHCWMRDRDDSPWYPSVRLFRQHSDGDWSGVINRIIPELERLAQGAR